ncbi:LamG-like jellyroll fold domain-containing protein [Haloferula sp. A504]|uniref:LamG-like jellyroll fold domain-containing protein n=1 Tax=Haloferula sp. A504 TaxID=3373601 RepID=UPI0031C97727|nr:LamG domain-containing protein [Verrucomicrobiaceae bacterium E54]
MRIHPCLKIISALLGCAGLAGTTQAGLMAHYSFDTVDEETVEEITTFTTPDSIGSAFATLGGGVSINGTEFIAGGGALEMTESGGTVATSVDGAVTSNEFDWVNGARTVTFWWKAKTPAANVLQGTYVSFGDNTANGTRFDIKESHAPGAATQGNLRVEVQGTGQTTDPTDFDDGAWHFVAVTVPDNATFADISWSVDGIATDLNASTSTLAIATGSSPLVFGDSIITPPAPNSDNRTPNGYLDEFQLYDEVLSESEILFLYNNPGSVIGARITSFASVGGNVWELTLSGIPSTKYEFRSSTTLDFTPGTLVGGLGQENPGTDPGTIDGSGNFVTTDTQGDAKVRMTLTGDPKDFVRGVSLP